MNYSVFPHLTLPSWYFYQALTMRCLGACLIGVKPLSVQAKSIFPSRTGAGLL